MFEIYSGQKMIITRRVYDFRQRDDFYPVLVDRLWPRGVSRNDVIWKEWVKEIAPSVELRKWFGHKPENWKEFKIRYKIELAQKPAETKRIQDFEKKYGTVVLLYAAKDPVHNHANVIREFLMENEDINA